MERLASDSFHTSKQSSQESRGREVSALLALTQRILRLEQQLEAYQDLYSNDLEMRGALVECKRGVLELLSMESVWRAQLGL
jgi:hypothetical protein